MDQFFEQDNDGTVDYNMKELKKHIMSIMDKYISFKSTSINHNLLWMNTSLKRISGKKESLYNIAP